MPNHLDEHIREGAVFNRGTALGNDDKALSVEAQGILGVILHGADFTVE